MKIFVTVFLWLTLVVTVHAQPVEIVMGPPESSAAAGRIMVFSVYYHNPSDAAHQVVLPADVPCSLSFHDETVQVIANRLDHEQDDDLSLPPRGYLKVLYRLQLPAELSGPVAMTAPVLGSGGISFTVEAATQTVSVAEKPADTGPFQDMEPYNLSALTSIYQPYAKNIGVYEPMYFLVGIDPSQSKFQFSFKYRFLDPEKQVGKKYPWIQGIHFAYTQTSFWDLASDSAPFEDTSYKPELFYLSRNIGLRPDWLKGCFIQTGWQHESNGLGGDTSRSTNYLYVKPSFVFMNETDLTGLMISPRIWLYLHNDNDTNPDLYRYRGYFDLQLKFGRADRFIVDTHMGWAAEGGSIAADVTYPMHRLFGGNIEIYLQLSYVNALAERFIDYKDRNEAVRVGLAIVR